MADRFSRFVCVVFIGIISNKSKFLSETNFLFLSDKAEIVFFSIFLIEMFLKIYGLGPSVYFRSMFNTFDFVVS